MRRISINRRFINDAGNDLISGKIHTIRLNYYFWKQFENQRIALFFWDGKPYQKGSKQVVFAEKTIYRVERILKETDGITPGSPFSMYRLPSVAYCEQLLLTELAKNDGLSEKEFIEWFAKYPDGHLGILHFTDFEYRKVSGG